MIPSLTLQKARSPECLFFECISGSRAYGTHTAQSDTDLRGVFVMPRTCLFGLANRVEQVSDKKNDETYYEIGRFIELLEKNNPNILEILFSEQDCIRFSHELFQRIRPEDVLSKKCESTFAGYALSQIRKARGLNKKIVNPMEGPAKIILDFCYVAQGQGSIALQQWLDQKGIQQEDCGLVKVPHMRDVFGIFTGGDDRHHYRGVIKSADSSEVLLSSIPKGQEPIGWMNFNRDGFKKYNKEYREYQDWLRNRNEARYATNIEHGRNYDSKNLMHTFRLLDMAEEIAREHRIQVRRPNREFLMRIRNGEFVYDDLIQMAEEKVEAIKDAFSQSDLPDHANTAALNDALLEIREQWYASA